ncbi:MAG: preprotein translocase subunit SecG [Hyphomonadaceae bacterium]
MAVVVLSLHLLVCICLIGLVLLQRSEGGALGIGGGGGGSLMSGRGAADALAKMTTFAGGFFLVTSLGLTVLSGAAQSSQGGSVFDRAPIEAPAIAPPAAPAESAPEERPDPLESSAPEAADTQLASAPAPQAETPRISLAPAAAAASTRAGPVEPQRQAAATPPPQSRPTPAPVQRAPAQTQQASTPAPQRQAAATETPTNVPAADQPVARAPLVLPNTSGGALTLGDDEPVAQLTPESRDAGGVEAVRRERAGPDQ